MAQTFRTQKLEKSLAKLTTEIEKYETVYRTLSEMEESGIWQTAETSGRLEGLKWAKKLFESDFQL